MNIAMNTGWSAQPDQISSSGRVDGREGMRRLFLGLLLTSVLVGSTTAGESVVVALDGFIGVTPPELVAVVTFPDDMADVDSMSIRFVGTLVAGVGQCTGDPEPRPLHIWPTVLLSISGQPALWEGLVSLDLPPGEFDHTFALHPFLEADCALLAGVTEELWCGIYVPNPPCSVIVWPRADITLAELILWYGDSTPTESRSWSSIKSVFR